MDTNKNSQYKILAFTLEIKLHYENLHMSIFLGRSSTTATGPARLGNAKRRINS